MSSIINLDNFEQGAVLKVKCRDGKIRTVTAKVVIDDGAQYPHRITEDGSDLKRSVTNEGRIYRSEVTQDSWDVFEIIQEVEVDQAPNASRAKPVARGYNRSDGEPKSIHGSKSWSQILWRDSSDNELGLFKTFEPVPPNFDQWFPLNEIEFQVEEVTESLRAHREARAAWQESGEGGLCLTFSRGYLQAKGLPLIDSDYELAKKP